MQAIPYAIFLLIEDDVRETENEHLEALFVEAFGDRQSFFNICIKELEKAESIIELHMDRTNLVERFDGVTDDDGQEDEAIPESKDDKINVILDLFKDKGLVTMTKYVKVFTQGNVQFLAIAHAKVNADFEKLFKKLKFEPDDDHIKHVKSFTKPSGEEMAGKGSMITTCCKIFYLKNFSRDFQERILNLFDMDPIDAEDDPNVDNNLASSQDYPNHCQSRSGSTLKICTICKFKTRVVEDFEAHMVSHPKCPQCGLHFEDESCLVSHNNAFHATKACEKCGKEVLLSKFKKHINSHQIEKGYSTVVSRGKVKASKSKSKEKEKETKETKEKPTTAYRLFFKAMRPKIRDENPDANPQDMIKLLNTAWTKEKDEGNKKKWEKAAKEANDANADEPRVVLNNQEAMEGPVVDNHVIQKCGICNLIIFNVASHMRMHKENDENDIENLLIEESVDAAGDAFEQDVPPVVVPELEEAFPSVEPVPTTAEEATKESRNEVATDVASFLNGDIVLVLRKSVHWPGRILSISPKTYEIMIFDKARTVENKARKYILPFTTDMSICDGRSSIWVKAWKDAKNELELLKDK